MPSRADCALVPRCHISDAYRELRGRIVTKERLIRMLIALLVGLAVVLAYVAWQVWQDMQRARVAGDAVQNAPAAARQDVGGPFTLVDHTGQTVTQADFAGQYLLVYFGFTYCPDVCPTELANMAAAMGQLDEAVAEQVQPVFITIDPERDTPQAMADYVDLFHPRMIGLTGSEEQIAEVAGEYRVYYRRVDSSEFTDYQMDHSSFVYLMGPDGENLAVFPPQTPADRMADAIEDLVDDPASQTAALLSGDQGQWRWRAN